MVYLITYGLNKEGQDYNSLIDTIEKNCSEYVHIMRSVFLVKTIRNENQLRDSLRQVMDSNDTLFISKITDSYAGWLDASVWGWLSKNVN